MIKLKENCTALNFKNMEKTKENFKTLLYGVVEPENIEQEISLNKLLVDQSIEPDEERKNYLDNLLSLKDNPDYQSGSFPRGIEKIILQTMEIYTFWHSINDIDSKFFLISENFIHSLVDVSITFMVSCELAKLFNQKPEDFSLYNVWKYNADEIENSIITDQNECRYISEQFERNDATRDQGIKRFLDFRNKSIAHNSNDRGMQWADFKKTMNFIIRVWGITDEYFSPNCFPRPIGFSENIFSPLTPYFKGDQIKEMKEKRMALMRELFDAASTNLLTGEKDKIKPFGELKITTKLEFRR